jgi:hypothetical protein
MLNKNPLPPPKQAGKGTHHEIDLHHPGGVIKIVWQFLLVSKTACIYII